MARRYRALVALIAEQLDPEPVVPSTRPAVCRQYGCTTVATSSDLCPAHQAAQDRLRATVSGPPRHVNLPVLPASRPTWHMDAACRGQGPAVFYPGHVQPGVDPYARARQLCATCPVREQCEQAGQTEHHGVWGGVSPPERRPRLHVA